MPTFRAGDLVRVPFPYTDRATRQYRPAMVAASLQQDHGLLWVVMITSAENRGWHDDVAIPDHAKVGLPAPSIIRPAKIATIEATHAAPLGRVAGPTLRAVRQRIATILQD